MIGDIFGSSKIFPSFFPIGYVCLYLFCILKPCHYYTTSWHEVQGAMILCILFIILHLLLSNFTLLHFLLSEASTTKVKNDKSVKRVDLMLNLSSVLVRQLCLYISHLDSLKNLWLMNVMPEYTNQRIEVFACNSKFDVEKSLSECLTWDSRVQSHFFIIFWKELLWMFFLFS